MSWWKSLQEQMAATGNTVAYGTQWLWNHTPFASAGDALFKFTANTTFHILEEVLALRTAVPTLIHNKKANKVINGMTYVIVHDVLPMIVLNAANNGVQNYMRRGYDASQASNSYFLFISLLTLADYLVAVCSVQQGVNATVHVAVLDAFAPAAFNSNKALPPPCVCIDLECNTLRKLKGTGREIGIFWANEALIGGISYLPYVGSPAAQLLTVMNSGEYIGHAATPERCERHKYLKQEFIVALGLTFVLSNWLMTRGLNATAGPLPFIYLRALRHILLALHVNIAAHMQIPLEHPDKATIPFDLFKYYERSWRFIIDVLWAGLLVRIPIDFKLEPGARPLISLSTVLQFGVRVFNSDLERETALNQNPWVEKAKDWLLPSMFRNAYDFTRDPVIAPYWPAIREGAISIFTTVGNFSDAKIVATNKWGRKTAAVILDLKFGMPQELTKIILVLSQEKDFWELSRAINAWFERHNVPKKEIPLVGAIAPFVALRDDQEPKKSPKTTHKVLPEQRLIADKVDTPKVIALTQLVSERPKERSNGVLAPNRLFSPVTRRPRPAVDQVNKIAAGLS